MQVLLPRSTLGAQDTLYGRFFDEVAQETHPSYRYVAFGAAAVGRGWAVVSHWNWPALLYAYTKTNFS